MVLWEITLGTAYFLGLKRTYRLALKIQRRLISPKRPKIRQFAHRRTRAVFDIALKVHHNIQQRDIEVGRNLGNWILRWLDKMKPSAQIRGGNPPPPSNNHHPKTTMTKPFTSTKNLTTFQTFKTKNGDRESDRRLFMSAKPFPAITMMMRPAKPAGQYRNLFISNDGGGIIRKDIMEWMVRN